MKTPDMERYAKIRALRKKHPDWSYRQIARQVGCGHTVVMRALDSDYRKRVNAKKLKQYNDEAGPVQMCIGCGGPLKRRTHKARDTVTSYCDIKPECIEARKRIWADNKAAKDRAARRTPMGWSIVQVSSARQRTPNTDLDAEYLLVSFGDGMCPCCGVAYQIGDESSRSLSPAMDKIYPVRGYVKGNVRVICQGCNQRKYDMSSADLLHMYQDTLAAEQWADNYERNAA